MANMLEFNLGKKGLTSEFIDALRKAFVNAESIRIHLLKSSSRDKSEVKKWAEEIVCGLGKNFTYKIIGYTIAVRKWRSTFNREKN
jgi:RNA-binding protein YhbY